MKQVTIYGAGGFTGRELIRLFEHHPQLEVTQITSEKYYGKKISEVFKTIHPKNDLVFQNHSIIPEKNSIVILATPDSVSEELVPKLLELGNQVIDLSGSFRIKSKIKPNVFSKLKGETRLVFDSCVYGLPEMNREKIKKSKFVSNPGCYPTSCILPIYFLGEDRNKIISPIVFDSKSGISGAGGRTENATFAFQAIYENFKAYKILNHQHEPEIEEYVSFNQINSLKNLDVIFTPHYLPVDRGILSTIVVQFENGVNLEEIQKRFEEKVSNEPFVRFLEDPNLIELKNIQNTNMIEIGIKIRKQTMVIVSAIDNLIKGAAGQAIQNLNLMNQISETEGLL